MNNEVKITTNQALPANNSTATEKISDVKWNHADARIKELLAKEDVKKAILNHVTVPEYVFIKKLKKPYQPEGSKDKTQKLEVMSGTTLMDAVTFELTLLNTELDPVEAVNKKYRIVDYTFALEANMSGGKFVGYAATGLKLVVTKLEEVK